MGMRCFTEKEMPLVQVISFNKLLEQYDVMAKSDNEYLAEKAKVSGLTVGDLTRNMLWKS